MPVPFHLLVGSTSLPTLTYASDRVTDVISVMSCQSLVQRVMSAVSHSSDLDYNKQLFTKGVVNIVE